MSKDSTSFTLDPNDPESYVWLNDHTVLLDRSKKPSAVIPDEAQAKEAVTALKEVNKRSRRSKGGQPGNTNAKKFGFYSRRLPARELEGLDEVAVTSLKDEIEVMRVFSRKVAELGSDVDDLEKATGLLRVLSLATTSINRLVKTHTRIPDPMDDPAALLRQALIELEDEWPELKRFGDQFRDKPSSPSPQTIVSVDLTSEEDKDLLEDPGD